MSGLSRDQVTAFSRQVGIDRTDQGHEVVALKSDMAILLLELSGVIAVLNAMELNLLGGYLALLWLRHICMHNLQCGLLTDTPKMLQT